ILEDFATAVAAYCESKSPPFVIQLDSAPEPSTAKGAIFPSTRAATHIAKLKSIHRVGDSAIFTPSDKR
ncbi:MAG: hypothetical protein WA679_05410, partial [Pseudolabrys sp.]